MLAGMAAAAALVALGAPILSRRRASAPLAIAPAAPVADRMLLIGLGFGGRADRLI